MSTMIKCYSEVITLPTFAERFEYLKLSGAVGMQTFGRDRYLNQILYNSYDWRQFRRDIIIRDNGCDLACEGIEILGIIIIHHINPVTVEDILNRAPCVFDPENVISTSHNTHNAIHFCDNRILSELVERKPNDTCPWKL
jgi:hypothetical protein